MRDVPWVVPQELSLNSRMAREQTRSFLLTISCKDDVSKEAEESVVKWIVKGTEMHHVVIEHGATGKRHLHAVLLYKSSRCSRKIQENVWARHVQPHHPDSIGRIAVKVQVCPGNDWYDSYLKKERDALVVATNYDPAKAETYFPTPEVQEFLMAKGKCKGMASPQLELDIIAWSESSFTNEPVGALSWLKHRMFVLKNMIPIADKRKLCEKAQLYWEYRNQIVTPNERELFLLKQLNDGPSYDAPAEPRKVSGGAPCI